MLSRTASNLFWMGRHLERSETAARLLDVGAR
ncbi:MAG TPA: alpha-E domain-containing protein, partial [Paracoccus sp. (in: a-proteobacteria)]|nr:alpha-E domain-containing protein [Paracoccus sp. (in: a-proteobacteria)]